VTFFLYLCGMNRQKTISADCSLSQVSELFSGVAVSRSDLAMLVRKNMEAGNMLVQPKCVTYSVFNYNQMTEDVLMEVICAMQAVMTSDPQQCMRNGGYAAIVVTVDFSVISGFHRNRKEIEEFLERLVRISFRYSFKLKEFVDSNGVKHRNTSFVFSDLLFTGYEWCSETPYCYNLKINRDAIPYLTFIGKGMGYTEFEKSVYRKLTSKYTKKLYTLLCDWSNVSTTFSVPLKSVYEYLALPGSFRLCSLNQKVLAPLKSSLDSMPSCLRFEYRFANVDAAGSDTGRKRDYNTLVLKFFKNRNGGERDAAVRGASLRNVLLFLADRSRSADVEAAASAIVDSGRADWFLGKCRYYDRRVKGGIIDESKMRNSLNKILRETFGVELRSGRHIENSSKLAGKESTMLLPFGE